MVSTLSTTYQWYQPIQFILKISAPFVKHLSPTHNLLRTTKLTVWIVLRAWMSLCSAYPTETNKNWLSLWNLKSKREIWLNDSRPQISNAMLANSSSLTTGLNAGIVRTLTCVRNASISMRPVETVPRILNSLWPLLMSEANILSGLSGIISNLTLYNEDYFNNIIIQTLIMKSTKKKVESS